MIKKIKEFFTPKPSEEQIKEYVQKLREAEEEQKEKEKQERLEQERKDKEANDERRRKLVEYYKNRDEPWIEIFSIEKDPETGMMLTEIEYNSAFITYLSNNGITGSDEDRAVEKYLSLVNMKVSKDIERENDVDGEYD